MFHFICDIIDDILRERYYKIIGKPIPYGYTSQEIRDRIIYSKYNSPFLFKLEKRLRKISRFVHHRIIDKIKFPLQYYRQAIVNKTHVLQTDLEVGQYHDESERVFRALFCTVIKFLEEDNYGITYYLSLTDEQKKEYPEHQRNMYQVCLDASFWYNVTYKEHEKKIEELYDQIKHSKAEDEEAQIWHDLSSDEFTQHNRAIYLAINEIEKTISQEKIKFMTKIVEVHESLWT
jgi:hypothetical protein